MYERRRGKIKEGLEEEPSAVVFETENDVGGKGMAMFFLVGVK